MRVGLVVALREEARALARVMSGRQRERATARRGGEETGESDALDRSVSRLLSPSVDPAVHRIAGAITGQPVTLAWAGAGSERAAAATRMLLEQGIEALLAVGFAGALSPALRPGDLLVATEVT
ncbi:MAG: hypothetical protein ACR2HB_13745, partial [Dehalococcoidia bacterium]